MFKFVRNISKGEQEKMKTALISITELNRCAGRDLSETKALVFKRIPWPFLAVAGTVANVQKELQNISKQTKVAHNKVEVKTLLKT